jgi:hypothetical protein
MNIEHLLDHGAIGRPLHIVINCRPDRIERNGQMGALIPRLQPDRVLLIGEPTRSAMTAIPSSWRPRVVDLGGRRSAPELLEALVAGIDGHACIAAIGNIHGQGEVLLAQLETLERL